MPVNSPIVRVGWRLLAAACLLAAPPVRAWDLRLAADTLSIAADDVPLRDILSRFHEAGIRVEMDDRINPLVTAHFKNREIGSALKRLLADCDYALSWRTIEGPAGRIRRLSEVFVYKTGDRRALTPLVAAQRPGVQAGANGLACVKGELLLRLMPGVSQEQFRALLLKTGATVLDGLPALGLYRLRLGPDAALAAALNALNRDPLVARAEPNRVYTPLTPSRLGAGAAATAGTSGAAAGAAAVGVLDSGLLPDLNPAGAVVARLDATAPERPLSDPVGHGSQMALLASGAIVPDGAAPLNDRVVPLVAVRTLDDNGYSSDFTLLQGMTFALEQGARVLSLSWGADTVSPFFKDAVAYAQGRGAVVVAAAGNEPTGRPIYPAALPGVVAVAGLEPDGAPWSRSNYGDFVALAAPAFAALPVGYKAEPGIYGGTSIATAYTAHVLARYFELHPKATPGEALAALRQALSAPASPGPDGRTGPGRLDPAATGRLLKL
jgi:hypothetical protein